MTTHEADQVVLYLLSPFPSEVAKLTEAAFHVWRDVLTRFPYSVGQEASRTFFVQRAPFRVGKLPEPDEFAQTMDRLWATQIEALAQERRDEAKMGWRQIEDKTKDDVGKASLKLLFDLLSNQITKAQYVEGLRGLHARWPALGFDVAAEQVGEGV